MLQLLYCAAGGADAEVFTFATRLTRLTGSLAHVRPTSALQQAGQAAPDWLGGTKIGASIKEFNNSYGRRGMARGAVVVIISDGWDTGDPEILGREMERLSRVAHRIVWVNPRTQSPEIPAAGRRDGGGLALLRRGGERAHPACPGRPHRGPGASRPAPGPGPPQPEPSPRSVTRPWAAGGVCRSGRRVRPGWAGPGRAGLGCGSGWAEKHYRLGDGPGYCLPGSRCGCGRGHRGSRRCGAPGPRPARWQGAARRRLVQGGGRNDRGPGRTERSGQDNPDPAHRRGPRPTVGHGRLQRRPRCDEAVHRGDPGGRPPGAARCRRGPGGRSPGPGGPGTRPA